MIETMMLKEITNDCRILLSRALIGKTIACFGIDGFGLFGQSDQGQSYVITDIAVQLDQNSDHDLPDGSMLMLLAGYSANKFGHLVTDKNFEISLNALLRAAEIDSRAWSWGAPAAQPDDGVILQLDVARLLEWY